VELFPRKSHLTLAASPAGLEVRLDGQPMVTPFSFDSVVGMTRNFGVVSPQTFSGATWEFVSWSDGGAAGHDITTPASDTTYTATFQIVGGPSSGLVAAYSFNAGSGTLTADASGNGNTGTISGATWTPAGRFGQALSFDGVNDWVTVADASSLDLTTGMTLSAWVYPTAYGAGAWRNIAIKERSGGEVYNLYANTDTNVPGVWVQRAGAFPVDSARGATQLSLNSWTHLASTYDGSMLRLFVNGTLVSSQPVSGPLVTSAGVFRIGGNSIWGEHFQGRIDEVRLYNVARGEADIQQDMATPVQ
jgi:hypothetical protein